MIFFCHIENHLEFYRYKSRLLFSRKREKNEMMFGFLNIRSYILRFAIMSCPVLEAEQENLRCDDLCHMLDLSFSVREKRLFSMYTCYIPHAGIESESKQKNERK